MKVDVDTPPQRQRANHRTSHALTSQVNASLFIIQNKKLKKNHSNILFDIYPLDLQSGHNILYPFPVQSLLVVT